MIQVFYVVKLSKLLRFKLLKLSTWSLYSASLASLAFSIALVRWRT